MTFYSRLADTADKLVSSKGKDIVITREVSSSFDPALGEDTVESESMTVKAVVLPASGGKIVALDLRFGLSDMTYNKLAYFIMAGKNIKFEPEPSQTVLIGGEMWTILGVTPMNPNDGDALKYDVAIRI